MLGSGLRVVAGVVVGLSLAGPCAAQDVETGRALAERLCARCHLNQGQGEKRGPMGVPGFRAVAERPGQSVEGIVAWLLSAPAMMPNHHLTADEAHALATFILSLKGK